LRSDRQVDAVFCLSAPLGGAPLAKLANPLNRLPSLLHFILDGVLQMIEGSEQLVRLQEHARDCGSRKSCPVVYLIAAAHDGLVPLESAWLFPSDYPALLVHRILLLGGDGPPPVGLPTGVEIWRTAWGMDNHISMITSCDLHNHIAERLNPLEEVELVVGPV